MLRSFIIAQEHIDKIFKPHEGNDEEAIKKQKVTLASDYTYDYN